MNPPSATTGPPVHRVALLFNASKVYDREVMTGIADYINSTRAAWDLFLEEDFVYRLNGIDQWEGDGIIADFDDPEVARALGGCRMPVVAVGGSYADEREYPLDVPYVATDNRKLVGLACEHLIAAGLRHLAFFGLPADPGRRWAREREQACRDAAAAVGLPLAVYQGLTTRATDWGEAMNGLTQWLQSLPKPVGIVAVTDARARQLLQACTMAGIAVPEQVALIGIDNDPLTRVLARIPLSSVMQGTAEMGRTAAHLLHQMLGGARLGNLRVVVPPAGIHVLASSQPSRAGHPRVMRALMFIRQYACQGIRTEQVADYVGVSRSTLESHFRRERQCSVHDDILRQRIEVACGLLRQGTGQIAEIARRAGFSSVQYMNTVFRRELNCTPREYQTQWLGSHPAKEKEQDQ
ncbi:XylR family transcriptional regulator [Amphibiibacter pelophylacis]|uniref:DNA-binding transcriptional regulator n=1 Tax=Amphibiibacter pelophylacis TaxID=1799477 RepID=A0ACC6P485_9BURK